MIKYVLIFIIFYILLNIYYRKKNKENLTNSCINIEKTNKFYNKKLKLLQLNENKPKSYTNDEINSLNCNMAGGIALSGLNNCNKSTYLDIQKLDTNDHDFFSRNFYQPNISDSYLSGNKDIVSDILYYAPSGCSVYSGQTYGEYNYELTSDNYVHIRSHYNDNKDAFNCTDRNKDPICQKYLNLDYVSKDKCNKLKSLKILGNETFIKFLKKLKISFLLFNYYKKEMFSKRRDNLLNLVKINLRFKILNKKFNELENKKKEDIDSFKKNKDNFDKKYLDFNDSFNKLKSEKIMNEDFKSIIDYSNKILNESKILYKNNNNNKDLDLNMKFYISSDTFILRNNTIYVENFDPVFSYITADNKKILDMMINKINEDQKKQLKMYNIFAFADDEINEIIDIYNLSTLDNYPNIKSVIDFMIKQKKSEKTEKYDFFIDFFSKKIDEFNKTKDKDYEDKLYLFLYNSIYPNNNYTEYNFIENIIKEFGEALKISQNDSLLYESRNKKDNNDEKFYLTNLVNYSKKNKIDMIYSIKNYNNNQLDKKINNKEIYNFFLDNDKLDINKDSYDYSIKCSKHDEMVKNLFSDKDFTEIEKRKFLFSCNLRNCNTIQKNFSKVYIDTTKDEAGKQYKFNDISYNCISGASIKDINECSDYKNYLIDNQYDFLINRDKPILKSNFEDLDDGCYYGYKKNNNFINSADDINFIYNVKDKDKIKDIDISKDNRNQYVFKNVICHDF